MARRRITHHEGVAAIQSVLAKRENEDVSKDGDLITAVRYLLEELAEVAPGNSVEVRVPPYGATQCIEGPRHTRGTPPNVVEMKPEVWFDIALGIRSWSEVLEEHQVSASGVRATLEEVLPLKLRLK
jgi:hypothetical protein